MGVHGRGGLRLGSLRFGHQRCQHGGVPGHGGKPGLHVLRQDLRGGQQGTLRTVVEHVAPGHEREIPHQHGRQNAEAGQQEPEAETDAPLHGQNLSGRSPETMRCHRRLRRAPSSTGSSQTMEPLTTPPDSPAGSSRVLAKPWRCVSSRFTWGSSM